MTHEYAHDDAGAAPRELLLAIDRRRVLILDVPSRGTDSRTACALAAADRTRPWRGGVEDPRSIRTPPDVGDEVGGGPDSLCLRRLIPERMRTRDLIRYIEAPDPRPKRVKTSGPTTRYRAPDGDALLR